MQIKDILGIGILSGKHHQGNIQPCRAGGPSRKEADTDGSSPPASDLSCRGNGRLAEMGHLRSSLSVFVGAVRRFSHAAW
jgi:hypothetical protein